MLDSLRKAVNNALEKKKRLGQYAVTWDGKKPVVVDYSVSQNQGGKRVLLYSYTKGYM